MSPEATNAPVRVFISYAWEDDEYRDWVAQLAAQLRQDGVDARWHVEKGQSIPEFMNSEVRLADKVLILCSPMYQQKVHAMEEGGPSTGLEWEDMLLSSAMFTPDARRKVVPALARGEWKRSAPSYLQGLPYEDLTHHEQSRRGKAYLSLLGRLTDTEAAPPITDSNNQGTRVDLAYNLEPHVEQSFRVAMAMADKGPISAGHALRAALVVNQTSPSPSRAFSALTSLLDGITETQPEHFVPASVDFREGLVFGSHLAASLRVARPFFQESGIVWGRDYISLALLADDPSLDEIADRVHKPLADLRNKWFQFVTLEDKHRSSDSWKKWWRDAGVKLPSEQLETSTYLFTWNPARFKFTKFEDKAREVKSGSATMGWSASAKVSVGDRVFLMRHHQNPLGVVGSGRVVGEITKQPHWDEAEAKKGRKYLNAQVKWDTLGEFPIVPLDVLASRTGELDLWTRQGTGLPIPSEVAEQLEILWAEELAKLERESTRPRSYISTDAISSGLGETGFKPSEHDSLDAKTQAEIFAALLIAEEVQLPFALGLLGDWGVGKTFFMRLMQESVSAIAGRDVRTRTPGSVSRAAQIEFNAWHYVDSDLWASLASHIFDGLSQELSPRLDDVQETRRRLRREIHSSQLEQEEARAAIREAETSRQNAASALATKQEERKRKTAKCERYRLVRVWEAILKVKPTTTHKNWPDVAKLIEDAERAASRLGITDAIRSADEVEQVLISMREVFRRGGGLARAFASDFTGKRAWWSSLAVMALLAFVVCWPLFLERIESLLNAPPQSITSILAPLLQLGTVAGAAAAWATKNIKSIASAIGYLETIQSEIRKPREELRTPSEKEVTLQKEIEKLDAQISTEQRKIEEADRQISAAQAEIQRINTGGLVYDFLEGRVRDSRYLDRLGLISVIRQDFERLKVLLRDWRKHGQSERRPARAGNESGQEGERSENRALSPIERIILYIDDLDRCPPKRVVEVLEAVHLLLAFDLFVVVVAVDARWLERSLNESYNPWTSAERPVPLESLHQFSAHNYLEKIFQIPFTLPAMDQPGYQRLVAKMLSKPSEEAKKRQREEEKTPRVPDDQPIPNPEGDPPPRSRPRLSSRRKAMKKNSDVSSGRKRSSAWKRSSASSRCC